MSADSSESRQSSDIFKGKERSEDSKKERERVRKKGETSKKKEEEWWSRRNIAILFLVFTFILFQICYICFVVDKIAHQK